MRKLLLLFLSLIFTGIGFAQATNYEYKGDLLRGGEQSSMENVINTEGFSHIYYHNGFYYVQSRSFENDRKIFSKYDAEKNLIKSVEAQVREGPKGEDLLKIVFLENVIVVPDFSDNENSIVYMNYDLEILETKNYTSGNHIGSFYDEALEGVIHFYIEYLGIDNTSIVYVVDENMDTLGTIESPNFFNEIIQENGKYFGYVPALGGIIIKEIDIEKFILKEIDSDSGLETSRVFIDQTRIEIINDEIYYTNKNGDIIKLEIDKSKVVDSSLFARKEFSSGLVLLSLRYGDIFNQVQHSYVYNPTINKIIYDSSNPLALYSSGGKVFMGESNNTYELNTETEYKELVMVDPKARIIGEEFYGINGLTVNDDVYFANTQNTKSYNFGGVETASLGLAVIDGSDWMHNLSAPRYVDTLTIGNDKFGLNGFNKALGNNNGPIWEPQTLAAPSQDGESMARVGTASMPASSNGFTPNSIMYDNGEELKDIPLLGYFDDFEGHENFKILDDTYVEYTKRDASGRTIVVYNYHTNTAYDVLGNEWYRYIFIGEIDNKDVAIIVEHRSVIIKSLNDDSIYKTIKLVTPEQESQSVYIQYTEFKNNTLLALSESNGKSFVNKIDIKTGSINTYTHSGSFEPKVNNNGDILFTKYISDDDRTVFSIIDYETFTNKNTFEVVGVRDYFFIDNYIVVLGDSNNTVYNFGGEKIATLETGRAFYQVGSNIISSVQLQSDILYDENFNKIKDTGTSIVDYYSNLYPHHDGLYFIDDIKVNKLTENGEIEHVVTIGNGRGGSVKFSTGFGAYDGKFYVSDSGLDRIQVYDMEKLKNYEFETYIWDWNLSEEENLANQQRIDELNKKVNNPYIKTIGFGILKGANNLTVSSDGIIYIVDHRLDKVLKFNSEGEYLGDLVTNLGLFSGNLSACPGGFYCIPVGINTGADNNIYLAHDKWIKIFSPSGDLIDEITKDDFPDIITVTTFFRGIDIRDDNYIFVTDNTNIYAGFDDFLIFPQNSMFRSSDIGNMSEAPRGDSVEISGFGLGLAGSSDSMNTKMMDKTDDFIVRHDYTGTWKNSCEVSFPDGPFWDPGLASVNFETQAGPNIDQDFYCVPNRIHIFGFSENTPPTIALNGAETIEILENSSFTDLGATWADKEDGTGIVMANNPEVLDITTVGEYILTYNYTDSGGLSTDTVQRIVKVKKGPGDISATPDEEQLYNDRENTVEILENDTFNGGTPTVNIVTVTLINEDENGETIIPGAELDEEGKLIIPPTTLEGDFEVSYEICEKAFPDNCSEAPVNITLITPEKPEDPTPPIPPSNGGPCEDCFEGEEIPEVSVDIPTETIEEPEIPLEAAPEAPSVTPEQVEELLTEEEELQEELVEVEKQIVTLEKQIKPKEEVTPEVPVEPSDFIKFPLRLPRTGIEDLETMRIIRDMRIDVVPNPEHYKHAGSENKDLAFWKQNLPETDRKKEASAYIVLPSRGMITPIVQLEKNNPDYEAYINGETLDFKEYLENGAVELPGSNKLPYGSVTNKVLAGHSSEWKKSEGNYKTQFQQIIAAELGDTILVYEKQAGGSYKLLEYTVRASYEVDENDNSALKHIPGKREITLTTCTPIGGNSGRWIVKAFLKEDETTNTENTTTNETEESIDLRSATTELKALKQYRDILAKESREKNATLRDKMLTRKIMQYLETLDTETEKELKEKLFLLISQKTETNSFEDYLLLEIARKM